MVLPQNNTPVLLTGDLFYLLLVNTLKHSWKSILAAIVPQEGAACSDNNQCISCWQQEGDGGGQQKQSCQLWAQGCGSKTQKYKDRVGRGGSFRHIYIGTVKQFLPSHKLHHFIKCSTLLPVVCTSKQTQVTYTWAISYQLAVCFTSGACEVSCKSQTLSNYDILIKDMKVTLSMHRKGMSKSLNNSALRLK